MSKISVCGREIHFVVCRLKTISSTSWSELWKEIKLINLTYIHKPSILPDYPLYVYITDGFHVGRLSHIKPEWKWRATVYNFESYKCNFTQTQRYYEGLLIGTWLMVGSCARLKLCPAVWTEYSSSHRDCQSLRNNPQQRQRPGEDILQICCLEPWPSCTIQPNPHFIATLPDEGHSSYFIVLCTQEE